MRSCARFYGTSRQGLSHNLRRGWFEFNFLFYWQFRIAESKWNTFHMPIGSNDEFIVNGNGIQFYKITDFDSSSNAWILWKKTPSPLPANNFFPKDRNRIDSNLLLSDKTYAKLIGSINNYQSPKLLAWYPFEIGYDIIALHESNQNQIKLLSVSSFNPSENLADNGISKILTTFFSTNQISHQ